MMNQTSLEVIDPSQVTVGEVVAQNYHAAGVFREYGVDFCCGGGVTLEKACEKGEIDSGELVERLMSIPWGEGLGVENYQAWQPDYLIKHITDKHHRFVREKVDEIRAYAAKVARVHGILYPENVEIARKFNTLAIEMLRHLNDEETTVFPLINELYSARLSGNQCDPKTVARLKDELERMEDDHEEVGSVMAEIRSLSHDYTPPEGACTTYRILYENLKAYEEDLHLHVHLENNILFKKAETLL